MATTAAERVRTHAQPRRFTRRKVIQNLTGYLFISPWIIGFLVFTAYPMIMSLYYSFTEYNVLRPPEWIGLDNYRELFFEDERFITTLKNSAYYVVFSVPVGLTLGFLVALLLNQKVFAMRVWRTLYYLPAVTPIVATVVLWLWVLDPNFGLINLTLNLVGVAGPAWLASPTWSKPALIMVSLWGIGASMVIYLAGLQGIPQHLYEAASIDGANAWQKFRNITIPMMSPVLFFNLIVGLIAAFQVFDVAYVATRGGPVDSTLFYVLYLWYNAFDYFRMGYASAMAWVLFVIILVVTLITFKGVARHVYYEYSDRG